MTSKKYLQGGSVRLADRTIGNGQACFVIAEAGVNHNGSLETAKRLVEIAVAVL